MGIRRYFKSKIFLGLMTLLLGVQLFIGAILPKSGPFFDDSYIVGVNLVNLIEPRTEESMKDWKVDYEYEDRLLKKIAKEKSRSKKSWQKYYHYLIESLLIDGQVFIECEREDEHFEHKDWIRQLVKERGVHQVKSKDGAGMSGLRFGDLYYHNISYLRYTLWLEEHHLIPLSYHSMSLSTAPLQLARVCSDYWIIGLVISMIMIAKSKKQQEDALFFTLPKQKKKWLNKTILIHFSLGLIVLIIPMILAGLCFGMGQFQYPVAVNLGGSVIPADTYSQGYGWVFGLSYMNYALIETYVTFLPVWVVDLLVIGCMGLMILVASQITILMNRLIKESLLAGIVSGLACWGLLSMFKPTQALLTEVSQSYVQIVCWLIGINIILWVLNSMVHWYKSQI